MPHAMLPLMNVLFVIIHCRKTHDCVCRAEYNQWGHYRSPKMLCIALVMLHNHVCIYVHLFSR